MTDYLVKLHDGSTFSVSLDDSPLGKGGEGAVYPVTHIASPVLGSAGSLVGKIYHDDESKRAEREAKCVAMLASVPATDSIVWNLGNLYRSDGKFAGFLMKRLQMDTYETFMAVAHTLHRRRLFPDWSIMHALLMSRNVAAAVDAVHAVGHMVGDINESNILVSKDTTVRIVDADSAQITAGDKVYPCTVGKPEFTAPEISEGSYRDVENRRTVATDMFAFSVMLFNALMGRTHPTSCIQEGEKLDVVKLIQRSIYPTFVPSLPKGFKKNPKLEYAAIPSRVHKLIGRGLDADPAKRPSFDEAIAVLDELFTRDGSSYKYLKQCKVSPLHWWDVRDSKSVCPMCRFESQNPGGDIWGKGTSDKDMAALAAKAVKKHEKKTAKAKKKGLAATQANATNSQGKPRGYRYAQTHNPGTSGTSSTTAPTTPTPAPQQSQANLGRQPGEPEEPLMVKKKMAVGDGTGGLEARPKIGTLLRMGELKFAFNALAWENRSTLPWLSKYHAVPIWWADLLGSILVVAGLYFASPAIVSAIAKSIFEGGVIPSAIFPIAYGLKIGLWLVPAITLSIRFLWGLGLWFVRAREVKTFGYGTVVFQSPANTFMGVLGTAFFSGIAVPLATIIFALFASVAWFIEQAFKHDRQINP